MAASLATAKKEVHLPSPRIHQLPHPIHPCASDTSHARRALDVTSGLMHASEIPPKATETWLVATWEDA